jgi:hypothetical protein
LPLPIKTTRALGSLSTSEATTPPKRRCSNFPIHGSQEAEDMAAKPLRFTDRRALERAYTLHRHTIAKMERALDKKYEEQRQLEEALDIPPEQETEPCPR